MVSVSTGESSERKRKATRKQQKKEVNGVIDFIKLIAEELWRQEM